MERKIPFLFDRPQRERSGLLGPLRWEIGGPTCNGSPLTAIPSSSMPPLSNIPLPRKVKNGSNQGSIWSRVSSSAIPCESGHWLSVTEAAQGRQQPGCKFANEMHDDVS